MQAVKKGEEEAVSRQEPPIPAEGPLDRPTHEQTLEQLRKQREEQASS